MKISLNWLQDFIKLDPKVSLPDIAWRLTEATAEVERVQYLGKGLDSVVVGEVIKIRKHKDAERLFVASVKISSKKTIQIVYGLKAPIQVGDKVPVAVAPTQLHGGDIKVTDFRGEKSEGMLCLDSEMIEGAPESLYYFEKSAKVGTPVTDILPIEDVVLEIDNHSITHRPDLFSHYGFCRELVALGLAKWIKQYPDYKPAKVVGKKKLPFKVNCSDEKIFSHYNGTIVENLDNRQSPSWMRYRLEAIGLRPLNAIIDITNYVMFEAGAPMHAFDKEKIKASEFIFRLSKEGESMRTLDGKTQKLIKDIMVVECDKKIVDLVGIMGGENSAIADETHSVYFHQGIYDAALLRKAMIALGHRTDAGTIFEKGIDAELSVTGQCRTLELTKQIFPKAKFDYEMVMFKHYHHKKRLVEVTESKIEKHLGIAITLQTAKKILEDLGFKVIPKSKSLMAEVPSWRRNSVTMNADLVEEIARIYGYSKIPTVLPLVQVDQPVKKKRLITKRVIRRNLISNGFLEELNWSFTSEEMLKKLGPLEKSTTLKIINPVTEDFKYMRSSQLPQMLHNLSRNLKMDKREWKTFEVEKVFARVGEDPIEKDTLSVLVSCKNSFTKAKGVLENLASELNMSLSYTKANITNAHPGKSAEIYMENEHVGHIYILHPAVKDKFDIKEEVTVVEIELEKLYHLHEQQRVYSDIIRYPAVNFDISVVIPEGQEFKSIKKMVNKVSPNLLKSIELKEIYRGKSIGEGRKSITLALTYQSAEGTIEAEQSDKIVQDLIKQIEEDGGEVRK